MIFSFKKSLVWICVNVSAVFLKNCHGGSVLLACLLMVATTSEVFGRDSFGFGWGLNSSGELGNGSTVNASQPASVPDEEIPPNFQWVDFSAGGAYSLGLGNDGWCYAWGENTFGQLGDGTTAVRVRSTPISRGQIPEGVRLVQIAAGGMHSLALGDNGRVYAWGRNDFGQLGILTSNDSSEPVEVDRTAIPPQTLIVQIAAGWQHSFALGSDGTLYGWGRNTEGQLGNGTTDSVNLPVSIDGLFTFKKIAGGRFHSLALDSDGWVYSWGANFFGQLGDGTWDDQTTPRRIADGVFQGNGVAIAAGWNHSLVVDGNGRIFTWGANSAGQLGNFSWDDAALPVAVPNFGIDVTAQVVAANGQWSMALTSDGHVFCWGANDTGQLGNGSQEGSASPLQIMSGAIRPDSSVTRISAGSSHALILAKGPAPIRPPIVQPVQWSAIYGDELVDGVYLAGGPPTSVNAVGFPDGLEVDPTTGRFSGVPRQVGVFYVQINAQNSSGSAQGVIQISVLPRVLSLNGAMALSREYDGTTVVEIAGFPEVEGWLIGDDVGLQGTASGSLEDPHVGINKLVAVTGLSLSGGDSDKYELNIADIRVDILPRPIEVVGFDPVEKSYDGMTNAVLVGSPELKSVLPQDFVVLSGEPVGTFDSSSVGNNHSVRVAGLYLSGVNLSDYVLMELILPGRIAPRELTLAGIKVSDRLYDGSLVGPVEGIGLLSGIVDGEEVTLAGIPLAEFDSGSVGLRRAIISGLRLEGPQAGNYSLPQIVGTAMVSPRQVSISGVLVHDKAFDGGVAVGVSGVGVLEGVFPGDDVILEGVPIGKFETAEVGSNKVVHVTGYNLAGADAQNYTLQELQLVGAVFLPDLTLKPLKVDGLSILTRSYNGELGANVTGNPILQGLTDGDIVDLQGKVEARFLTADAGLDKPVAVSGLVIAGPDASKYRLIAPTLTGTITARPVLLTGVVAQSKVEDGSAIAELEGQVALVGVLPPDDVSVGGSVAGYFDSSQPGERRPVSITGGTLLGTAGGNYQISYPRLKASIWRKGDIGATQQVFGCGGNDFGALGNGTVVASSKPIRAARGQGFEDTRWYKLTAGSGRTAGLSSDGKVYGWGLNSMGQLGDGSHTDRLQPTALAQGEIPSGVVIEQLALGENHTLGLGNDGKVYAWGANTYGQLGNNTFLPSETPVTISRGEIPPGVIITEIAAGGDHSLALASDGAIYSWGRNDFGQVGNDGTNGQPVPSLIATPGILFSRIAAGRYHNLAVDTEGWPWAWGGNSSGQLADGTTISRSNPSPIVRGQIPLRTGVIAVAAGSAHSLFLDENGNAYAAGANAEGQLGTGDQEDQVVPSAVVGMTPGTQIQMVVCGARFSMATAADGSVYGWGANESGQLGDESNQMQMTPSAMSTASWGQSQSVVDIVPGTQHAMVVVEGFPPIEPPAILPSMIQMTYGESLLSSIPVSGASNSEFFAVGMPNGVNIDAKTGVLFGHPQQVGIFVIQVTASNSAGFGSGVVTLNVAKKPLTVSGLTVPDRRYDGSTLCEITGIPVLGGIEAGDGVDVGGSPLGILLYSRVGSNTPVAVSGLTLVGEQASNYQLEITNLTANTKPRLLTIGGLGSAGLIIKEYDGNADVILTGTPFLVGLIEGDTVVLEGSPIGHYDSSLVGTNHTVLLSGFRLAGGDAAEYELASQEFAGEIQPMSLDVTGLAVQDRLFDGSESAVVVGSGNLGDGLPGEEVYLVGTPTASFSSSEVANLKQVLISGLSLAGTSATNYALKPLILTASITNTPPKFDPIADQVQDRTPARRLQIQLGAQDPDWPLQSLSFGMLAGPFDATVSPEGVFEWMPDPSQPEGVYNVTVAVTDGAATDTASFRVELIDVNDPPQISAPSSLSTYEDTAVSLAGVGITDLDAGSAPVQLRLNAGNGTFHLGPQTKLQSITGTNDGREVIIEGSVSEINLLLLYSTYLPDSDFNGEDVIVVMVDDLGNVGIGGHGVAEATLPVHVTPVNDPPSFAAGSDLTVVDDAGPVMLEHWATDIIAGPPDERSQLVRFEVTNSNPSLFSSQPAVTPEGNLTFTPVIGSAGTALVIASIRDSGGTDFGGVDISNPQSFQVSISIRPRVVGRWLFYNESKWAHDGNDSAIAIDKEALFDGEKASFSNYSSFDRGINGLMVDVLGFSGMPTLRDFSVTNGKTNDTEQWEKGPLPSGVQVRRGAGISGSDRVELIWPSGSITNTWLRIEVLSDSITGLLNPDVFYFGSVVGDTGDSPVHTLVNSTDLIRIRRAYTVGVAPITSPYDINRDGKINSSDTLTTRLNLKVSPLNQVPLLNLTENGVRRLTSNSEHVGSEKLGEANDKNSTVKKQSTSEVK